MAEEQKNVGVSQETKVQEIAPISTESPKNDVVAPITDSAPAEDEPVKEAEPEDAEKEVKPVEEGYLSHKAQGLSFPKNLIPTKEFFFFGTDAVEPKTLIAYQKSEKSVETAHHNIAWASETGKGLLFIGERSHPTGLVNLSDASEPAVEGAHKFTLTSKGNKHSFKAANTAERDNWVAQLKLKIAEAKELAAAVTDTETYKSTIESFKPVVAPKEEAKPEETAKVDEIPKEDESAKEEAKEEKTESPKPLKSKRASFFNFIKKEEEKKEEKKEEAKAEETPAVVEADKPAEEVAPKVVEAPTTTEAATTPDAPVEEKPAEETKPAESPKEKSTKRNSFFGGVFSKKEKKAAEPKPVESTEAAKEEEAPATTETAPVIPPVESTTPLAVDVSSPATAPTETTEAATNSDSKKDVKEKRKPSLPFLGRRERSPGPSDGEEKSKSPFSKLRDTIRIRTSPKNEEKPAEDVKEATLEVKAVDAPVEPAKEEPVKSAEPQTENKPENVVAATPAVTAAA